VKHLTVLICTHNRKALLQRALDSLNRANRPTGWLVDILLVANACTDETLKILNSYRKKATERNWLPLTVLVEAIPGKSNALNRAIPELASDMVSFVDDDHRVDEDYLAGICSAAESYPKVRLFCGRILPDWDGSEPAWVHDKGPYRIYPLPVPLQDYGDTPHPLNKEGPIPGGGNLFLSTTLFDRIGGFSTKLGPKGHNLGGGEDTDFILRALNSGEQLFFIPNVMQYHHVDTNRLRLRYLLTKSYQRSRDVMHSRHSETVVRLYMLRKLAGYIFNALFSLQWPKTRFYLVRTAAALGEIHGARRG